jgi:hypothetical protein
MDRTGKGRLVLTSVAALTTAGGFVADWNRTHLFNPEWPPHARFHDALTVALGTLLGACGLYFLLLGRSGGRYPVRDLELGALLPSIFWVAQGASFAFPGAAGFESEFPEKVPRLKGVWVNERFFSALVLALIAAGYAAERRRLAPDWAPRLAGTAVAGTRSHSARAGRDVIARCPIRGPHMRGGTL